MSVFTYMLTYGSKIEVMCMSSGRRQLRHVVSEVEVASRERQDKHQTLKV